MHEFDGKKYALVVVQEPIRARMCGFGDKVGHVSTSILNMRLIS